MALRFAAIRLAVLGTLALALAVALWPQHAVLAVAAVAALAFGASSPGRLALGLGVVGLGALLAVWPVGALAVAAAIALGTLARRAPRIGAAVGLGVPLGIATALWPLETALAVGGAATLALLVFAPEVACAVAAAASLLVAVAFWPGAALALAAPAAVAAVALVAPAQAFVLAILLFGLEGTVKILATEDPLFGVSPVALGAAAVDAALLAAVALLAIRDRGQTPRAVWRELGRGGRLAVLLLGGWIALALVQIVQSGDLVRGVAGFRLTHAYAFAAAAGGLLALRAGGTHVVGLLLGVLGLVAGYAAVRAFVGPSDAERAFAQSRPGVSQYGDAFRNVGSFSGAVGLVSFLVPAGVFAFGLAVLVPRYRVAASITAACAAIGVVSSYARAAWVALAVGVLLLGLVAMLGRTATPRRRLVALATVVAALAAGVAGVAVASLASEQTRERARGFVDPLSDESLKIRLETWERSAREVARHPLGTGLGTVGRASYLRGEPAVTADNSYLKILREQGFLGGALFIGGVLLACAVLARAALRAPPEPRAISLAAVAAFGAFLVLLLAGEYVEQPGKVLAWTLLAVAAWHARPVRVRADGRAT